VSSAANVPRGVAPSPSVLQLPVMNDVSVVRTLLPRSFPGVEVVGDLPPRLRVDAVSTSAPRSGAASSAAASARSHPPNQGVVEEEPRTFGHRPRPRGARAASGSGSWL